MVNINVYNQNGNKSKSLYYKMENFLVLFFLFHVLSYKTGQKLGSTVQTCKKFVSLCETSVKH